MKLHLAQPTCVVAPQPTTTAGQTARKSRHCADSMSQPITKPTHPNCTTPGQKHDDCADSLTADRYGKHRAHPSPAGHGPSCRGPAKLRSSQPICVARPRGRNPTGQTACAPCTPRRLSEPTQPPTRTTPGQERDESAVSLTADRDRAHPGRRPTHPIDTAPRCPATTHTMTPNTPHQNVTTRSRHTPDQQQQRRPAMTTTAAPQ